MQAESKRRQLRGVKRKNAMQESRRFLALVILALCGFLAFQTVSALRLAQEQTGTLAQSPITVVLDAGHGGEDGGAVAGDGAQEKDLNLAIALKLRPLLESSGIRVVMVRDSDCSIGDSSLETVKERKVSDLHNRLQLAQQEPDAFFLSIHQNHYEEPQYYGTQVFYSPNHPDSQLLAESIQASVTEKIQPENTRECKEAGNSIYLLWNLQSPAVIVECGFLSNPSEAKQLQDSSYQTQMAFSIWSGFLNYLEESGQGDSLVMMNENRFS